MDEVELAAEAFKLTTQFAAICFELHAKNRKLLEQNADLVNLCQQLTEQLRAMREVADSERSLKPPVVNPEVVDNDNLPF